jgi:hypothetical protein
MLLLGHVGITLGAAVLLSSIIGNQDLPCTRENEVQKSSSRLSNIVQINSDSQDHKKSWLSSLITHLDIKPLIIGSLLPDIIDKPIGLYFLRKTFSSGRIFGHTLLFSTLATLAGIYSYRRYRKTQPLILSFGTITHLILDVMWHSPKTLFWPMKGHKFEKEDTSHWIERMFRKLRTESKIYVPELIGAVVLAWLMREKL